MKDKNDPGTIDLVDMVECIFGINQQSPGYASDLVVEETKETPTGPCWGVDQETRR